MGHTLAGQRILITRAPDQAGELRDCLLARGADPRELPAIEVAEPISWARVDAAIDALDGAEWLVFTSPNGVRYFLDRYLDRLPHPPLPRRLAAVGPATAEALAGFGLLPELVPEKTTSEGLADALLQHADLAGRRVVLARGNLADATLPTRLADAGALVSEVVTYRTLPAAGSGAQLAQWLQGGELDWITLASGSAMHHLLAMLPNPDVLRCARLASIGPKTSAVVRHLGYGVSAEARVSTMSGLVDAIEEATTA